MLRAWVAGILAIDEADSHTLGQAYVETRETT